MAFRPLHKAINHVPTLLENAQNQLKDFPKAAQQTLNGIAQRVPSHLLHSASVVAPRIFSKPLSRITNANVWPYITGSRLKPAFRLFLDMADDMSMLNIYRIDRLIGEKELNGRLDIKEKDLTLLASIPDPHLVYSAFDINRYASPENVEMITQLFTYGKRITRYRGMTVTWDQSVDSDVWTFNIDTANLLRHIFEDGVGGRTDIRRFVELGVGGGSMIGTFAKTLPNATDLRGTDISPYALMCTRRNVKPYLTAEQSLSLFLGKGLMPFADKADMIVSNPPYIPHMKKPDATDPYRGTGLIKEIVESGTNCLNPDNPNASIYVCMSSLSLKDFHSYLHHTPHVRAHMLGEEIEVPLKIFSVNENDPWLSWLISVHGLVDSRERLASTGFRYWHKLSAWKITPR